MEVINQGFAFICHCFNLGYFTSCVGNSLSADDGDETSGVQKSYLVFKRGDFSWFCQTNFYLLLGGSLIIDLGLFLVQDYRPKLLFPKFTLIPISAFTVVFVHQLADLPNDSENDSQLHVERFSSIKLGLIFNYVMKIGTTILLTVLLIGVGRSLEQEKKNLLISNSG